MKSLFSRLPIKVAIGALSMVAAAGVMSPKAFALTLVDTELFLSVDVSGSVDATEFNLQRQGYVNAFNDPTVQSRIASLPNGLAVAFGYFSSFNQQNVAVDWTLLKTATDASNFAALIGATTRPFSGFTAVGNAIQFAATQLLNNAFDGKKIIDVSGDGATNDGIDTLTARNAAAAQGITINGLPILGEAGLQDFYQNNVVTANGFLIPAADFASFDAAVQQKIGREVGPEIPTPALLPGLIGMGVAAWRKRKGEASEQGNEA